MISKKLGIIVILTSDYMYIIDINTTRLIDYKQQPSYIEVTCTPLDDILISDGYSLEIFKGKDIASIDSIALPLHVASLKFIEYEGKMLKILCEEFYNWGHQLVLMFDCDLLTVTVIEN